MTRSTQLRAAVLAVTAFCTMGLDEDSAVLAVERACAFAEPPVPLNAEDIAAALASMQALTP